MKTQTVRLIDVFALGPFMIWSARQLRPGWAQNVMILSGLATIVFNGINYVAIEQGREPLP